MPAMHFKRCFSRVATLHTLHDLPVQLASALKRLLNTLHSVTRDYMPPTTLHWSTFRREGPQHDATILLQISSDASTIPTQVSWAKAFTHQHDITRDTALRR